MVFQIDAAAGHGPLDAPDPFTALIDGELRLPLEGGVGLGHKGADPDIDLAASASVSVGLFFGLHCQLSNGVDVLHGLGRQADHEIELHDLPAQGEGVPAGVQQVLLGNTLVDDPAQALAAGLGGQGKSGFAYPFDLIHD